MTTIHIEGLTGLKTWPYKVVLRGDECGREPVELHRTLADAVSEALEMAWLYDEIELSESLTRLLDDADPELRKRLGERGLAAIAEYKKRTE